MTCWCGLRRWPRDGACIAGHRVHHRSPKREAELRALADYNARKQEPVVWLTTNDERNIARLAAEAR